MIENKEFYYGDNGNSVGPISSNELIELLKNGKVNRETLIWSQGYADWIKLSESEVGIYLLPPPRKSNVETKSNNLSHLDISVNNSLELSDNLSQQSVPMTNHQAQMNNVLSESTISTVSNDNANYPVETVSGLEHFINAYRRNYANFKGRASRAEYWYFSLFNFLSFGLAIALDVLLLVLMDGGIWIDEYTQIPLIIFSILYFFISFIPGLSVSIRRLHDTNHSGWWLLLMIIPIINLIGYWVIFYFFVVSSDVGRNAYGENPYGIN